MLDDNRFPFGLLFSYRLTNYTFHGRYNACVDTISTPSTARTAALAARFPLVTHPVEAAGRSWRLTAVRDQDALLSGVETDGDVEQFPYGLLLWASALGLAGRLAEEPSLVAGKRVLEIGAGVGLPGLAAHALGAAEVIQTDYQDDALALCAHNAVENGVPAGAVRCRRADWRDFPDLGQPFPLVIGSDVLYERTLHPTLRALLPRLVTPGGRVLLSDPVRPQALAFIDFLEQDRSWVVEIESRLVAWEGEQREIALFMLHRKAG